MFDMSNISMVALSLLILFRSNILKLLIIIAVLTACFSSSFSQEVSEIKVNGVVENLKRSGQLKDSIIKTEVVDSKKIEKKQASNISEAIKDENGIESREGCSICGMRRVRINGLRGEHTTVLIDGVPLNSTVSSYYGFDALGTNGIDRIEISRGAGAALIAPEAIGGVVNIVRKKATEDSSSTNLSIGDFDYKLLSGTVTKVNKDRTAGTTISGQYSEQGQMDFDNNGVNESPRIESYVLAAKHYIDIDTKNNLTIDVTSLKSDTFGGPMNSSDFRPTANTGGAPTFENNDVRRRYTGNLEQITEIVQIQRNEATLAYTRQLDSYSNLIAKQSYALQIQDSWYEGSDYYHKNQTLFTDIQYNNQLTENHFFTIGIDYKNETLKSESYEFFVVNGRSKDNYDYASTGLYLRDIWTPSSTIELSSALRVNKITTDWTDQTVKENEIDETLLAPRIHLKWKHTDALTSRFAAGIGYRAPLTFFESEHGLLDDGFDINISDLEKSQTFSYSFDYDLERFIFNGGASHTEVKNLAFVDDTLVTPVLKSFKKELGVSAYDLTFGYQFTKSFSMGLTYEYFDYEDDYKALMVIAAIEQRVKLDFEYETDKLLLNMLISWIGSRDLADYGYEDRFNIYSGSGSAPKLLDAPSFFTVDLKGSFSYSKDYKIYAGVRNLLDETQEESPLFFDASGDFDVTHIYGPLRGRQVYAGVQTTF